MSDQKGDRWTPMYTNACMKKKNVHTHVDLKEIWVEKMTETVQAYVLFLNGVCHCHRDMMLTQPDCWTCWTKLVGFYVLKK